MPLTAAAAVALALALDLAVAEPPARLHPVAWFGQVIAPVDGAWSWPRAVGALATLVLPLAAAGTVAAVVALAGVLHPLAAVLAAALALFVTTSLRMLVSAAQDVIDATEDDLERARDGLRALAGRDATALSPGQLRSAAVESAAENLADGLVGPLVAFAAVAALAPLAVPATVSVPGASAEMPVLALAAAAAAWVKAVNTIDSMLGYRSKPVGLAGAHLDDAVMWLPARLSAVLIAVAALSPGALAAAREWAREPPSPNSGWPMGTLAAALGVRLEKPGAYVLAAGPALPSAAQGRRGVRIVAAAGLLAGVLAAVVAGGDWLLEGVRTEPVPAAAVAIAGIVGLATRPGAIAC